MRIFTSSCSRPCSIRFGSLAFLSIIAVASLGCHRLAVCSKPLGAVSDKTQWVNPLQGTDSTMNYSNGNTLPLIGAPFAMTSWAPQTAPDRWFFSPHDKKIDGFRATRQPSPWMGDYGHFSLLPQVGDLRLTPERRASAYRQDQSVFLPQYLRVRLLRYETDVELTATPRAAIFRIRFPQSSEPKRLILGTFVGEAQVAIDSDARTISGYTRPNSGSVPSGFAGYFFVRFDCPIDLKESGLYHDDKTSPGLSAGTGDRMGAYAGLLLEGDSEVLVRVGTSFISIEQARRNLDCEVGNYGFDEVRSQTAESWNKLLGRIEIETDSASKRRTFYSCLYRTFLFPRQMHELGENGDLIHYSPLDGRVHKGDFCTSNGLWDTHRTAYPLYALLCPDELSRILRGWINFYAEGGWLPRWPNPGETGCMIGTHIDAVFADAATKGIGGFDLEKAFEGMWKHANEKAPDGRGRPAIDEYIRLGYAPEEAAWHCASATLDYAYNDYCIGQVAGILGRAKERDILWCRAMNYRNIYDPKVGFLRGRRRDGGWAEEPFREFNWGGIYVEGSAWQCTWAVPHDPAGLADLMGGDEALVAKLDRMLALPPKYQSWFFHSEIHEMTEMACADFGQYAHSNQPVHHVLYLYAAAGRPDRTQYWVRRVLSEMYGPGIDGFPGDEDNGSMGSWYVLSALGIYPLCPGHPTYVFGSPMFRRAVIHLQSGKDVTIEAPRNSPSNVYVSKVFWNNKLLSRVFIGHDELAQGGTLRFEMTDHPAWTSVENPHDRSFSLSRLESR